MWFREVDQKYFSVDKKLSYSDEYLYPSKYDPQERREEQNKKQSWTCWHMPVISGTWEAKPGGVQVQVPGQPSLQQ